VTSSREDLCRRIAQLRLETAGPRGKSSFAKSLGLSPSTYDYYERSRVPPADVLVRIAERTGADLRWLLTGQPSREPGARVHDPIVQRAAKLMAECPNAAGPLVAFLDILSAALAFPKATESASSDAKNTSDGAVPVAPQRARPPAPGAGPPEADVGSPAERHAREEARASAEGWIPVLGRSAAGVTHFWANADEAAGVTTLDQVIARHVGRAPTTVRPGLAVEAAGGQEQPVQLVVLTDPGAEDLAEFVIAPEIKRRCADAFVLRIDGDSMAPDIRHGDLVVLSPRFGAADGKPAVVQLAGQIGVTCKLYRQGENAVHLVPTNEHYDVATFPAEQVVWALRVLARVRV